MINNFKGIVWPRKVKDVYRYVVVGMLVSDKPIEEFENKDQLVLDGYSQAMFDALPSIRHKAQNKPNGDANHILMNLNSISID